MKQTLTHKQHELTRGQTIPPTYLCPHCLEKLEASEIEGYSFQCLECDEDFYATEVYQVIGSVEL